MKEFKPLIIRKVATKKVSNRYVEETKTLQPKKKTAKKRTKESTIVANKKSVLSTTVSANYEGNVSGIIDYIKVLPEPIQRLINTNELKRTVVRAGYSMFIFDNKMTLKVIDKKIGKQNYLHINILQGKKELFNNIVKW